MNVFDSFRFQTALR